MRSTNRCLVLIVAACLLALVPARVLAAQTLQDLFPELQTLVATDGAANDNLGYSMAVSGDTLVVGMPWDDVGTNVNQGSVRVFVRSGSSWVQQAAIIPGDGAAGDLFGYSVSISGDTIVVGVPGDDVVANTDQGSARVFVRSGSIWFSQGTLTASDGAAGDEFGFSVAVSGDTIVAGVPYDDVGANFDQGSVRVFARSGLAWSAQTSLVASDGAAGDFFGYSVAISGDTVVVGVLFDDVGANANQGSARVFARINGAWFASATLTASDGVASDAFGATVAISGDTIAVGMPYDDVGANTDQGSVRLFARVGGIWTAQSTLTASDGAAGELFGYSLAVAGDTVVAGVPNDRIGNAAPQGSARVFVLAGAVWTPQATLIAGAGTTGDFFGTSVAVSADQIFVGVENDDVGLNLDQGSVSVFGNYRVYNATRSTGHDGLASAIAAGTAGDRLLVGAAACTQASGIVDASQKRFTFVGLEPLTLPSTALMSLATGTVFERSLNVASAGLTVGGKLVAPDAGTVTFEQLSVASGGQFLQRGSTVLVNQGLSSASGGVCYLQGPVLAESVSVAVGGQNRVAGDTDVFGNYTNNGATVIQRGILYIYGALTNTGTMTGQYNNGFLPPSPGDGYSIGGDYAVSADSSLVLAEPVWWLRVGGNFDMAINSPARFVMDAATLELTGLGTSASQSVEVFGADLGPVQAGFASSNYLLGALRVRAGATVQLVDARDNAPGAGGEAIYTNELTVPAGATLVTNGHRIYTRAAVIGGSVSNAADIVVVPAAPPCPADLYPDGVVNGADLGILLSHWGPCQGSCVGDINGDGSVSGADLGLLLASWGSCAQ